MQLACFRLLEIVLRQNVINGFEMYALWGVRVKGPHELVRYI